MKEVMSPADDLASMGFSTNDIIKMDRDLLSTKNKEVLEKLDTIRSSNPVTPQQIFKYPMTLLEHKNSLCILSSKFALWKEQDPATQTSLGNTTCGLRYPEHYVLCVPSIHMIVY